MKEQEPVKIKPWQVLVTVCTLGFLVFGAVCGVRSCEREQERVAAEYEPGAGDLVQVVTVLPSGVPAFAQVADMQKYDVLADGDSGAHLSFEKELTEKGKARRLKKGARGTVCEVATGKATGEQYARLDVDGKRWWVHAGVLELQRVGR